MSQDRDLPPATERQRLYDRLQVLIDRADAEHRDFTRDEAIESRQIRRRIDYLFTLDNPLPGPGP